MPRYFCIEKKSPFSWQDLVGENFLFYSKFASIGYLIMKWQERGGLQKCIRHLVITKKLSIRVPDSPGRPMFFQSWFVLK